MQCVLRPHPPCVQAHHVNPKPSRHRALVRRSMQAEHDSDESVASASGRTSKPQLVAGLEAVGLRYKALLLDQFGVLHDGRAAVPGAPEAVQRLSDAGLKLMIISNSSRRSSGTLDKLAKLGFTKDCFIGAVTSGELSYRYLTSRPDDWWQALGTRCIHIGWSSRGAISLEGYGVTVVDNPSQADFILAHGTEALQCADGSVLEQSIEELCTLVQTIARERGSAVPMVVANPDIVTVDGEDLVPMPGTLARAYAAAGGQVMLMGKPAPLIYAACAEVLQLPARDILAVGDSLEHDIAGAGRAGMDSLFIASGIHRGELMAASHGNGPSSICMQTLGQLVKEHAAQPQYVTSSFVW